MAGVFSKLYIQIVFAVRNRRALIDPSWKDKLYKYIIGSIQARGHKVIAINGMPDHIHILIEMKPVEGLFNLVREIKRSSQKFITENNLSSDSFNWQAGYGAFSYSYSHLDRIGAYIKNQKGHHSQESFKQEYGELIRQYDIEMGRNQIFDFHDIYKF